MAAIDTRVVEAKFNNSQFGKGVADTISSLDRLKGSLKLEGATKGLQDVSRAATEFNGSAMEQGAGRISASFSALQGVALGALASIGAKAVAVGSQVLNSFTFGPITAGFQEYETNMKSIQTILANTQVSGAGLEDVNAALDELNHYSDKTIYNFSEMAKNIGTFTAAGVDLDTATGSIKGIANLAALSGSNSEQASGAMYQLSQAISAGRVSLQDWNSVVNAGMGGTVFQRALAQTAEQMGTLAKGAVTLEGDMQNVTIAGKSFRESIDATNGPSWLTGDVLTATLNQFTGDLTDAELAAQGFSAEMIASIQAQAQVAVNAATEVKTLSGLMDTLKEGVTSGWSQTFRILVGDFEEAKTLFTGMSNAIGGWLGNMADSRNAMLTDWKELGGRDVLIEGLTETFWLFAAPLAQIGQAFRQIFPKSTAADLFLLTVYFTEFIKELQPGPETLDRLQRTFAGLFAILGIGWEVIKAVATFLGQLLLGFTDGDQGILRFTASIGDFLVELHEAIKTGDGLTKFFDKLREIIFVIINPLRDAGQFLGSFFEGIDLGGAGTALGEFVTGLLTIGSGAKSASDGVENIKKAVTGFVDFFKNIASVIGGWANSLGDFLGEAFGDVNYDDVIAGLQTGMLGALTGVLYMLKNSLTDFSIFGGGDEGLFGTIKEGLGNLSGTLGAMQNNLNATALLKLAAAIGILAISVVLLATVDGPGLLRATAALSAMFINLAVGMRAFTLAVGVVGAAKLNLLGPALIMIAIAIGILVFSVKALAELSWEELAKGMLGLAVMLGILAGTVKLMSGNNKGMIRTAAGLILLGIAIRILVESVEALSQMDWGELAKGLGGVAALLIALALFTKFAKAGTAGLLQGAGILLISFAIKNLADAVVQISALSWEEIAKGMVFLGASLLILTIAMRQMAKASPQLILASFAMINITNALSGLADVFIKMQTLSWDDLARGIVGLAAAFGVIVLAMKAFQKVNFLKMAGVAIVAFAIQLLADALLTMSGLSWDDMARGLTALAGTMLILSISMKFMQGSITGALALLVVAAALNVLLPVIQAFASMSWSELLIGLAGLAGVFVVIGLAGLILAPLVPVLLGLGAAIALLGVAVFLAGVGVAAFAAGLILLGIAGAGATAGIVAIVSGLIGLIPMVIEQIGLGIIAFANVIAQSVPAIANAIVAILTAVMTAIQETLPMIGQTFLLIIAVFLHVLTTAIPMIVEAGLQLLIALLRGIGDHIGRVVDAVVDIVVNFLNALANNMGRIINAGANLIISFLEGLGREIPRVVDAGFQMIIDFVNGVADTVRDRMPELIDAGANLADALIDGIVEGVSNLAGRAWDAVTDMAQGLWDGAMDVLGISSPSKKFIYVGEMVALGLAKGVDDNAYQAISSTERMGEGVLGTMGKSIAGLSNLINDGMSDLASPVITPVLDLSNVQRDASGLSDILAATPISLQNALVSARDASAGLNENQSVSAELAAAAGTTVTFNQHNTSPKALSPAEIYRQTNNQISRAKGVLTNAG